MKTSRLVQNSIFILPILSIVASFGVVAHQTVRRDRLKKQLTTYEQERTVLETRYKELSKASGRAVAADATTADSDSHHHNAADD